MNSASGTSELAQHYLFLKVLIDKIMDIDVGSDENEELIVVSCNIIFNLILQVILFLDTILYIQVSGILNRIPKAADTLAATAK